MAGAKTTVVAASAVGVASASPLRAAVVPCYLSSVSGGSIDETRGPERRSGDILWPGAIFRLSFTVIFVGGA